MPGPAAGERYASEVYRLYADAEAELIRKIAQRVDAGLEDPLWMMRQLEDIRQLKAEAEAMLKRLREEQVDLEERVIHAYLDGVDDTAVELSKLMPKRAAVTSWGGVNPDAVRILVSHAITNLAAVDKAVFRVVEDTYRAAAYEAVRYAMGGVETRRQASQRILNNLADRGITGFVDKAGRQWDLASYAEMVARTALGRAYVQGHLDKYLEEGYDLIYVNDSPEECPICRLWEGKVLSITGRTPGYPTVDQARADGLWHPNCTHGTSPYIPGLTRLPTNTENPRGYEEKRRQRAIERQIRKWKRREAAAITDQDRELARRKVLQWQANMRAFIRSTDRQRLYHREQIRVGVPTGKKAKLAGLGTITDPKAARNGARQFRDTLIPQMPKNTTKGFSKRYNEIKVANGDAIAARLKGDRDVEAFLEAFRSIDDATWHVEPTTGTDTGRQIAKLFRAWDQSVSDRTGSMILQMAVRDEFGLGDTVSLYFHGADPAKLHRAQELYRTHSAGARKVVRAMYEHTQERLKEAGVDKIYALRGIRFQEWPEDVDPTRRAQVVEIRSNPLSSWSVNEKTVGGFGSGLNKHGMVIGAEVPAERIFSWSGTGLGTPDEFEVVLIGGVDRVSGVTALEEELLGGGFISRYEFGPAQFWQKMAQRR